MSTVCVSLYECVCPQSTLAGGTRAVRLLVKEHCLLMSLPLKKKKNGTLPGSTVLNENNIQS